MKVNIDELGKIITILLFKLKEGKGGEIELMNDYYWDINAQELYNPYEYPKTFTLGQLSDDLAEIDRLLKPDDPVPYDLKRVSNILKALSIENEIAF